MSVATEFPPEVYIPVRARTRAQLDSFGCSPTRPALSLVLDRPAALRAARPPQSSAAMRDAVLSSATSISRSRSAVAWEEIADPAGRTVPLRLTRRGLIVLSVLTCLVGTMVILVAYLSHPSGLSPVAPQGGSMESIVAHSGSVVTVESGDSLWSIAARVAPGRDPRAVVDNLRSLNHLQSVALTPGQTLKVG